MADPDTEGPARSVVELVPLELLPWVVGELAERYRSCVFGLLARCELHHRCPMPTVWAGAGKVLTLQSGSGPDLEAPLTLRLRTFAANIALLVRGKCDGVGRIKRHWFPTRSRHQFVTTSRRTTYGRSLQGSGSFVAPYPSSRGDNRFARMISPIAAASTRKRIGITSEPPKIV